jgi:hypothetical protein
VRRNANRERKEKRRRSTKTLRYAVMNARRIEFLKAKSGLHSISPTQSPGLGLILGCLCFREASSTAVIHRVIEVLI